MRLLSTDIPPDVRNNVLKVITWIDGRRGFDWEFDLAITRLGGARQYDSDEIDVNFGDLIVPTHMNRDNEQAWGLSYVISARFASQVDELSGPQSVTTLIFSPFIYGDYAAPETLQNATFGARSGLQVTGRQTTMAFDAVAERWYVGRHRYQTSTGLELRSEYRQPSGLRLFGSARFAGIENHQNDNLDGHMTKVRLGLLQGFGGTRNLGGAVFGEWRNTERSFDSYDRFGVSVFWRYSTWPRL